MRHRTGTYTVCKRVRASFSPEILQAGAVKGLILIPLFFYLIQFIFLTIPSHSPPVACTPRVGPAMAAREQVDDRVSWPISKVLGVHPLLYFSVWPKQGVPSPGFRVKCYCDALIERLCETLLPENLGNHCREWLAGKTESEIKLLIQENSKPQDPIVYTNALVTKDQSGWGFTVKQGATTIHEDSAAYTVSSSNGGGNSHRCPPLDCLER